VGAAKAALIDSVTMTATVITTVAAALRAHYGAVEVIGQRIVVAGPKDTVIEVELLPGALKLHVRGQDVAEERRFRIGRTPDAEALAAAAVWVVGELIGALDDRGPTLH